MKQFQDDMNKMFENAKSYNEDDSQIYKDAVALQVRALSVFGSFILLYVMVENLL